MLALAQLRAITNFEATHASLVGLDFETATFTAAGFFRFVVFPQQLDGFRLAFFGSAGEPELSSHEAVSPQDVVISVNVVGHRAVVFVEFLAAAEATETGVRVRNQASPNEFLEGGIAVDLTVEVESLTCLLGDSYY